MPLQGPVLRRAMLVSMVAAQRAGCLGTVQSEPLALGPRSSSEALTAQGRPQPILSPVALAGVLSPPAGPLGQIQRIRDADLDRLHSWCRQDRQSSPRALLDPYA